MSMTTKTKICCVCTKDNSPYRCPQCNLFYCCLNCSKQHKSNCNPDLKEKPIPSIIETKKTTTNSIIKYDILSDRQVENLNNSNYINSIISSKRLRSHILEIDDSTNKQESLKKLRQNSKEFELFIQNMLQHINR